MGMTLGRMIAGVLLATCQRTALRVLLGCRACRKNDKNRYLSYETDRKVVVGS
jgi:hypothetical protein